MNYIDFILILVALSSVLSCIKRGFVISSLELLSWVGSLVAAFLLNKPFSSSIQKIVPAIGVWTSPLCFIITTILVKFLLDQLSSWIIFSLEPKVHQNIVNRILGTVPGAVNGLLWSGILASFLLLLPFSSRISNDVQDSRLASPLVAEVGWLGQRFSAVFSDALNRGAVETPFTASAEEPVILPYKVKHPRARLDLEGDMLALVNKERQQRGLKALKADLELTTVARQHSLDMFNRGYFSHITPEGASPFYRMARAHVGFLTAGENLALAQSLGIAHSGLMKSPGHRANILNPAFGRLGIGILDGGIYGLMITQNFRN